MPHIAAAKEKSYEIRLRRKAARQGLTLTRSRRRDPHAVDHGVYTLLSDRGEEIASGVGLEAVEIVLEKDRPKGTQEIRWADLCKLLVALGYMPDTSKGECLKVNRKLKKLIEDGRAEQTARGRYRLV